MYSPSPSSQPDREWPRPLPGTQNIPPPPPAYLPRPESPELNGQERTRAARLWLRIPVQRPVATLVVLVLLVIIYLPAILAPDFYAQMVDWGALEKVPILQGEWWRLFTATFLHGPGVILHIVLNGWALYMIGMELEAFLGKARFLAIYFVSALAGSVASFIFISAYTQIMLPSGSVLRVNTPGVGASGAIFGLIGALGVYYGLHRRLFGRIGNAMFWNIIIVVAINMAIGFSGLFPIDNAAHVGGLMAGVAMGYILCPRYRFDGWRNPAVRDVEDVNKGTLMWVAAVLAALVVVAIFLDFWLFYKVGFLTL